MPTYEYQCRKCGKKFDYLQSISAKPLTKCIHCSGRVTRLIGGGSGLIFKGSGFYITDYKNKPDSSKKPAKPESSSKNTSK